MSEPRIIKKYPNRRLYDTAISRYITLEDVKQLALDNKKFRVVDARTKEDITRSILLQIISEQEEQGSPIFTTEVLAQIIRFYGDTLQGMMGNYLEKSLQTFIDQQHLVREQMSNFMGKNPLSMMTEMAERNLAMWQAMNERLYGQQERQQNQDKDSDSPSTARKEDKNPSNDES
jgi:polyhydroxyalkanoate synthesis repressor PhaR